MNPDKDFVRNDYFALCQFVGACRHIAKAEHGNDYAVERLQAHLAQYEAALARLKGERDAAIEADLMAKAEQRWNSQ